MTTLVNCKPETVFQAPEENYQFLEIYGRKPLEGNVHISGAKNSALVIMTAALLCQGECRIRNVPHHLADVNSMAEILQALGAQIKQDGNVLEINARHINQSSAPYELVSQLRASFFAIGPLLARFGAVQMPFPGGCAIGTRPVDLHVHGLQKMGAQIRIEHGVVHAVLAGARPRLQGARIHLNFPSVGATETLMMAATLAEGETLIQNAAQEPEVVDLADFCCAMGARISGAGTPTIQIEGVQALHSADWSIIPDRIEAGTFLVAGAITGSELTLAPVIPDHLSAFTAKLEEMGHRVWQEGPNCLRICPSSNPQAVAIETRPFPGFPTDMQAPFMSLLAVSQGNSVVTETLFENRLGHVAELMRMGANVYRRGNSAFITGVPQLSGAPVMGTDLRASAALVLAGLAAEGKTIVRGLHHLDRGYEELDGKLRSLGADIHRVSASEINVTHLSEM